MEGRIMQPGFFGIPMVGGGPLGERPLAPPLYIGNLEENVYEEQLFGHFSKYGAIHSLKIVKDNATSRSRGFGYINFMNPKDAENARLLSQYEKIGKLPVRLMYKRNIRDQEGNVFVKNVDPSVTHKELHTRFSQVGNVLTVKIATNAKGESLGYGYVQMERKEDAETAIKELNKTMLKEKEISCGPFVPRPQRPHTSSHSNLYIKHLPNHFGKDQKKEIEELVLKEFAKIGEIASHVALYSEKHNSWFAYVSYKLAEDAEKAIGEYDKKPVFGNELLYVAKHQSKFERYSNLKSQYSSSKNENNLFVKNLKPDITEEKIRNAFGQFGEISSVGVKRAELKPNDVRGSGYIAFKDSQAAQMAQGEGHRQQGIRELFIDNQEPYINFWQPKSVRDQFKASKMRVPHFMRRIPSFDQFMPGPGMFPMFPFARMMPYQMPMMDPQFARPRPYMNRYPAPYQRRAPYGGGGYGRQNHEPRGQYYEPRGQYHESRGQYHEHRGQNSRGGSGRPNTYYTARGGQQQKTYQGHGNGQQTAGQRQNQNPDVTKQTSKDTSIPELDGTQNLTVQNLKQRLNDFLKLDADKQRNILGELLYPKIVALSGSQYAPKITGMLVDFDVLSVQDILEMLENDQILSERIQEAMELIQSEGKN